MCSTHAVYTNIRYIYIYIIVSLYPTIIPICMGILYHTAFMLWPTMACKTRFHDAWAQAKTWDRKRGGLVQQEWSLDSKKNTP